MRRRRGLPEQPIISRSSSSRKGVGRTLEHVDDADDLLELALSPGEVLSHGGTVPLQKRAYLAELQAAATPDRDLPQQLDLLLHPPPMTPFGAGDVAENRRLERRSNGGRRSDRMQLRRSASAARWLR